MRFAYEIFSDGADQYAEPDYFAFVFYYLALKKATVPIFPIFVPSFKK